MVLIKEHFICKRFFVRHIDKLKKARKIEEKKTVAVGCLKGEMTYLISTPRDNSE